MPDNLFCKSLFIIYCILGNKIKAILLVNTYNTRYGFINKKFVKKVYYILEIEL